MRTGCLMVAMALVSCSSPAVGERAVASPAISLAGPAVAGRVVDVTYRFEVSPGPPLVDEEYMVFLHAFDSHGARAWTADHEPPSDVRIWKPGSTVEYVRPMSVPPHVAPGRVTLELGLYSRASGERLPLSGDDSGRRSYRVASLEVAAPEDPPAIFVDGWHDLEAPASDVQWHWSKAEGAIWLRNPGRDSVVVLDLDQPMLELPHSQRVTVRVAAADVGTFTLSPGHREVSRIPVTASQLGKAPMVTLTVVTDRTYVPARLPGAASEDTRELGVRVFSAYLESP